MEAWRKNASNITQWLAELAAGDLATPKWPLNSLHRTLALFACVSPAVPPVIPPNLQGEVHKGQALMRIHRLLSGILLLLRFLTHRLSPGSLDHTT